MRTGCYSRLAGHENGDWVACLEGGGYDGYDGTRHLDMAYGPGALAEMEAALREDRGTAEDAVT